MYYILNHIHIYVDKSIKIHAFLGMTINTWWAFDIFDGFLHLWCWFTLKGKNNEGSTPHPLPSGCMASTVSASACSACSACWTVSGSEGTSAWQWKGPLDDLNWSTSINIYQHLSTFINIDQHLSTLINICHMHYNPKPTMICFHQNSTTRNWLVMTFHSWLRKAMAMRERAVVKLSINDLCVFN